MAGIGDVFADRTVLITGGRGGIGSALADAFESVGARHVIIADLDAVYSRDGVRTTVPVDVTDCGSVGALAQIHGGDVDILVNNAGVNASLDLFAPQVASAALKEFSVNALGLLNMVRAFAEPMAKREGALFVNILSSLSTHSVPALASYCASKAAAMSIALSAREALAPKGVRVFNVYPRMVDTKMSANMSGEKMPPAALAAALLSAIEHDVFELHP